MTLKTIVFQTVKMMILKTIVFENNDVYKQVNFKTHKTIKTVCRKCSFVFVCQFRDCCFKLKIHTKQIEGQLYKIICKQLEKHTKL